MKKILLILLVLIIIAGGVWYFTKDKQINKEPVFSGTGVLNLELNNKEWYLQIKTLDDDSYKEFKNNYVKLRFTEQSICGPEESEFIECSEFTKTIKSLEQKVAKIIGIVPNGDTIIVGSLIVLREQFYGDWKTYTNEEYGYEIKYPATFKVNENVLENVSIGSEAVPYIGINIYQGKTNMDFESVVQEILENEYGTSLDMSKIKFTQKEIQGIMSIEASFKQVIGGYDGTVTWDYIPKNQKVYRIALLSDASINGETVPYETLHDQILSTFKFTE